MGREKGKNLKRGQRKKGEKMNPECDEPNRNRGLACIGVGGGSDRFGVWK